MQETSIKSPMARARGLGSAKDGTGHWIAQRVTAIMLLPVSLYLIYRAGVFLPTPNSYDALVHELSQPCTAIAIILAILAGFYHAALGVQVIIEDYIHGHGCKFAFLILNKIIFFSLSIVCLFAIIKINFGL